MYIPYINKPRHRKPKYPLGVEQINKVYSYNRISSSNKNEHTDIYNVVVKYDKPHVELKKQDIKEQCSPQIHVSWNL